MSIDIVIVTPCLNAVETIDQTIQSVVSQAGRFRHGKRKVILQDDTFIKV